MSDKPQTIFRTHKESGEFFIASKALIQDAGLSWKAKGMMMYFMSLPNDWTVYLSEIETHATDGKGALSSGIKELKAAGYVHKEILRDSAGVITGTEWHIYEQPFTVNQLSGSGLSGSGESDTTNNDSTNNNSNKNELGPLAKFNSVFGSFSQKEKSAGYEEKLDGLKSTVGKDKLNDMIMWAAGKEDMTRAQAVNAMCKAAPTWNSKQQAKQPRGGWLE